MVRMIINPHVTSLGTYPLLTAAFSTYERMSLPNM